MMELAVLVVAMVAETQALLVVFLNYYKGYQTLKDTSKMAQPLVYTPYNYKTSLCRCLAHLLLSQKSTPFFN